MGMNVTGCASRRRTSSSAAAVLIGVGVVIRNSVIDSSIAITRISAATGYNNNNNNNNNNDNDNNNNNHNHNHNHNPMNITPSSLSSSLSSLRSSLCPSAPVHVRKHINTSSNTSAVRSGSVVLYFGQSLEIFWGVLRVSFGVEVFIQSLTLEPAILAWAVP